MFNVISASFTPATVAGTCLRQSTSRSIKRVNAISFNGVKALGSPVSLRNEQRSHMNVFHQRVAAQTQGRRAYRSQILTRAGWNDFEWSKVSVVSNDKAAEGLYTVVLDVGPELVAGYSKPGQFMQMRTSEEGKPAFIAIASPPGQSSSNLEFLIKTVEGSTAGEICALAAGGSLEVSPVMGKGFDLSNLPEDVKSVVIFATGSGISPIRALIESSADMGGLQGSGIPDIRLYYGGKNAETMAFTDKFESWENVNVTTVFSGDEPKKYVQQAFQEDGSFTGTGASTGAVLCGQKEMAEAATEILLGMGVEKDTILMNF